MIEVTQSLESFKFSVNSLVINKTTQHEKFTAGFQPYQGSIDDLIEAESMGFSYSMATYKGDGRRNKENIDLIYGVALDFDNTETIQVVNEKGKKEDQKIKKIENTQWSILNSPLHQQYTAYVCETCSSKPDWPRFRAIIVFENPVSLEIYEEMKFRFVDDYPGLDLAAVEGGRGFYGNNDPSAWRWKNENAVPLPQKYVDDAIASLEIKKAEEKEKAEARRMLAQLPSFLNFEQDEDQKITLIQGCLDRIPPRTMKGANQYHFQIRVAFGVLNSGIPRNIAIAMLERWSPTNPKIGWYIDKIANSNDKARSTCNIGTVFYYGKEYGFKFPKINKPSWQQKVTQYVKGTMPKIKEVAKECVENKSLMTFLTGFAKAIMEESNKMMQDADFVFNKPINYYYTGGDLPTKEQLAGRRVIVSNELYQEFYERVCRDPEWQYALDVSSTGSGKSHVAGQLQINNCFKIPEPMEGEEIKSEFHKIILSMPGHRNPTVKGIEENFPDLPARHDGYELDYDKKTALGNPFRVRATDETIPELRTQSNCHWTAQLNQIYASGRDPEKVCKVCPHFKKCKTESGDGYGFLNQYHEAMSWQYASTSPQLISKNLFTKKTIGVFDEIDSGNYEFAKTIHFGSNDYIAFLNASNQHDPTLRADFDSFFKGVENVLGCKKLPIYGLENHDILFGLKDVCSGLGDVPDNVDDLLKRIERIEVLSRPDLGDLVKKKRTELINALGIGRIAGIWSGRENGSLRFSDNKIAIQFKNQRMIDGIKNTATSIMQSATVNPDWLCLQLGIEKNQLMVFAKYSETPENLLITQVTNGFGVFNKQRDKEASEKKKTIMREYILSTDGITQDCLGEIDYKAFADGENLTHFADGRGSNLFQKKKSVVSYGIPFPHIGSAVSNYITMTGDRNFKYSKGHFNRAFTDYYKHLVRTEVIQEIGRLRANRRGDEQLHYWICGDGDLSWLELLGYRFEQVECKDINVDLCSKSEQVKAKVFQIGLGLAKRGKEALDKGGVKDFVQALGVTQGAVSKWINAYVTENAKDIQGKGFEVFKQLLLSLVYKEESVIKYDGLTDSEMAQLYEIQNTAIPYLDSVAKSDAPQSDIDAEIANSIGVFIQSYGSHLFTKAISYLPVNKKDAIASSFLSCFSIFNLGTSENTEISMT
jgi:hypothetical protein